MPPILYQFPACPYCMRARIAFDEKGLPYRTLDVDPKNKPAALFANNPRGRVPVLVDGETVVYESRILLEYLDEAHPQPPLMPTSPAERARVRLLIDLCDNELALPAYRLAQQTFLRAPDTPVDQTAKSQAISDLAAALDRLAPALGDRPYLAGPFGLADIAFAPWVTRLDLHDFPETGIPSPLRPWIARLQSRPTIARHITALT